MAFSMGDLGLNATELNAVKSGLKAEDVGNNEDLEVRWAMKAMEHANVHYNLITSVDAAVLKLTPCDDKIYKLFRESFPKFVIDKLTEETLKSTDAKAQWREFCEQFKGEVEDYNQGTLLRLDCSGGYDPDNTILSVRVQFLAIEIARNKEGFNHCMLGQKDAEQS